MESIIVSRHPAAIEFIADCLEAEVKDFLGDMGYNLTVYSWDGETQPIPVISSATPDDVRDKHVYGNLPLHLAAVAAKVTVIEFIGNAPRGQEYTLADMKTAGAVLRTYKVILQ